MFNTSSTTVMEEPYPGEAVVSRAPNTWILGHARFSTGMESTPPTSADSVKARENMVSTVKNDMKLEWKISRVVQGEIDLTRTVGELIHI